MGGQSSQGSLIKELNQYVISVITATLNLPFVFQDDSCSA